MPSKALLRPAEALAEVGRIPGAAEAVTGELDVASALRRRDEVVHDLDDTVTVPWLDEREIAVLRGHARLAGPRVVDVDGTRHEAARAVVLATGSDPRLPDIPGLAEVRPWTNREATTAGRVPARLLVVGGGPVGVELAQAWATLGSRVVVLAAEERLLQHEEPFASEQVHDALRERGVDVRVGARVTGVARTPGLSATLESGDVVEGDEVLVAVGRRPRTSDLGLETVGLEPGHALDVDESLRVRGFDWLYAVGDVNGRALLTHMGKYQARIASDVILGRDARLDELAGGPLSPRVVFTEPQVAAVGHTLASALEAGIDARAVDQETSGTAGGSFYGRRAPGTSRLVIDERRRVVVGATFVGADVSELVHAATIAVVGEVPLERLWHATPPFPTRSEIWLRMLETYGL
jgi:dihydrolipoamide dehydrogenase